MSDYEDSTPRAVSAVQEEMDAALLGVEEALKRMDEAGEIKRGRESFSTFCGDSDTPDWQDYTAQSTIFSSTSPADHIQETEKQIVSIASEHGFKSRTQMPSGSDQHFWEFSNEYGDRISVYVHQNEVHIGGITPCFPPG